MLNDFLHYLKSFLFDSGFSLESVMNGSVDSLDYCLCVALVTVVSAVTALAFVRRKYSAVRFVAFASVFYTVLSLIPIVCYTVISLFRHSGFAWNGLLHTNYVQMFGWTLLFALGYYLMLSRERAFCINTAGAQGYENGKYGFASAALFSALKITGAYVLTLLFASGFLFPYLPYLYFMLIWDFALFPFFLMKRIPAGKDAFSRKSFAFTSGVIAGNISGFVFALVGAYIAGDKLFNADISISALLWSVIISSLCCVIAVLTRRFCCDLAVNKKEN